MGVCSSCLGDFSDAALDDGFCPHCVDHPEDSTEESLKDFMGYCEQEDE